MQNLFDINIYGTQFELDKCTKDACNGIKSDYSQHQWAFIRVIELLEKEQYKNYLSNKLPSLYKTTINKYKSLEINDDKIKNSDKTKIYKEKLIEYYKTLKLSNINKTIEAFSLVKFYENETYRSIGAYLHIVQGLKNLDPSLYFDSVLDNYGFLLDNLFKENDCTTLEPIIKLGRVAKYFERILDALKLGKFIRNDIDAIKKICSYINKKRKTNEVTNDDIIELQSALSPKQNIQPNQNLVKLQSNQSKKNDTMWWWFKTITDYIFQDGLKYT